MQPKISIITLGVADIEISYRLYEGLGFSVPKYPNTNALTEKVSKLFSRGKPCSQL